MRLTVVLDGGFNDVSKVRKLFLINPFKKLFKLKSVTQNKQKNFHVFTVHTVQSGANIKVYWLLFCDEEWRMKFK